MRHTPRFLKRTLVKALCVRLPEFSWTLLAAVPAFIFSNIYFQEVFGDAGIDIYWINIRISLILSLIVSALASDFIPGFSVYIANEFFWEGTRRGLKIFKNLEDLEAI